MNKDNIIERTTQKLRYARIHLEELKSMPLSMGRGSDYERAHHEAFLSQLFGAYDAFIIELNYYLDCGLPEENLTLGKIWNALNEKGISNPIIAELYKLNKDNDSWFKIAKDMRDLSTHVKGIPLAFKYIIGGPSNVSLKHPKTMEEMKANIIEAFELWLLSMERLIETYRRMAMAG